MAMYGRAAQLKRVWQGAYQRYSVRANVQSGVGLHVGMGSSVSAPHSLTIGDEVHIGKYCTVEVDGCIGSYTMLGNNVGLIGRYDHDHRAIGRPIRRAPWIGDDDYHGAGKGLVIDVGEDVWIGFGAVVLSGTRIGRGAVVAAGSVVVTDVAPYVIAAGCPARPVGVRFTPSEIEEHERLLYGSQSIGGPSPVGDASGEGAAAMR
jgi:acetyltransferase-like isoleucine patch superfamily enzyme